jgi:hypothetical protein
MLERAGGRVGVRKLRLISSAKRGRAGGAGSTVRDVSVPRTHRSISIDVSVTVGGAGPRACARTVLANRARRTYVRDQLVFVINSRARRDKIKQRDACHKLPTKLDVAVRTLQAGRERGGSEEAFLLLVLQVEYIIQ